MLKTAIILLTLPLISFQQENAEFLIENAKICGSPFADPIWIPVLDTCTEKCDQTSEYCVENEELVQQCNPLPDECKKLLALRLRAQRRQGNVAKSLGAQNRDGAPINLDDKVVERSGAKRVKFSVQGNSKLRTEPFQVTGDVRKSRKSDSTRHRVKRF